MLVHRCVCMKGRSVCSLSLFVSLFSLCLSPVVWLCVDEECVLPFESEVENHSRHFSTVITPLCCHGDRKDADRILDLAKRVLELLEEAERAQDAAQDAITEALQDITSARSALALVRPGVQG